MSRSIHVNNKPVSFDVEANAGVYLGSGERWWGTLVKWRHGTSGKWQRFNVVDVHPFDEQAIKGALRAQVSRVERGRA